MSNKITIGCDISKEKLDFYCRNTAEHFVLENSSKGMQNLSKWMEQHQFNKQEIEIGFEHTGIYTNVIRQFCNHQNLSHYVIGALELKKSLGIVRGKNDVVDSKRICEYLFEKGYKINAAKPINIGIGMLKRLDSLRALLVAQRAGLITRMNEEKEVLKLDDQDIIISTQSDIIKILSDKIVKIEQQMKAESDKDKGLNKNFELLNSITGIGKVTAYQLIITTENFTRFDDPRKFASYGGIAPFGNQSGKFQGKSKVSKLANKRIKSLLDICARSAMVHDAELRLYYQRKVAEGKNERSVRNAVRFKLLTRIFSVIRNQSPFQKKYYNNLELSKS